jgi:hypothetical protein
MKLIYHTIIHTLLFAIILTFPAASIAQNGNTIIWKEGKSKIRLTISTDEIAELNINSKGFPGKLAARYGGSSIKYKSPLLRIWKVKSSMLKSSLGKGTLPSNLQGNHSLVLKEASGRRRVLRGNVVVIMKKNMTKAEVTRWAAGKKLVIIKQLSKFSNSYLIKSLPGMASLTLAESLQGDINVISSSPDWWTEISAK